MNDEPVSVEKGDEIFFVYNPLTKHRNLRCLCGSGLKVKRCCGQINSVPLEVARIIIRALKHLGHE